MDSVLVCCVWLTSVSEAVWWSDVGCVALGEVSVVSSGTSCVVARKCTEVSCGVGSETSVEGGCGHWSVCLAERSDVDCTCVVTVVVLCVCSVWSDTVGEADLMTVETVCSVVEGVFLGSVRPVEY